jgi:cyclopropane fatty-acyl-phospholipid synthase-like methyltransferase
MFNFLKKRKNLEGGGERMDINFYKMNYNKFDMYQKSHYKRYIYAQGYVNTGDVVGDFACGSGYGSMILAQKAVKVIGADINQEVVEEIKIRYRKSSNTSFIYSNVLDLSFTDTFDKIVSFETVEHLSENDIPKLFAIYNKALKESGELFFSTPYNQEKTEGAIKMGFHLTFYIKEDTIRKWMSDAGFEIMELKYQNYSHHDLEDQLEHKDFIICRVRKVKNL